MRLHADWFTGLTWRGMGLVACFPSQRGKADQPLFDGETPLVRGCRIPRVGHQDGAARYSDLSSPSRRDRRGGDVQPHSAKGVGATPRSRWRWSHRARWASASCSRESGTSRAPRDESLLNPFLVAIFATACCARLSPWCSLIPAPRQKALPARKTPSGTACVSSAHAGSTTEDVAGANRAALSLQHPGERP